MPCHFTRWKSPNYDVDTIADSSRNSTKTKYLQKLWLMLVMETPTKTRNQHIVVDSLCERISSGDKSAFGVMIESNILRVGKTSKCFRYIKIEYGKSITDACISWSETVGILENLSIAVKERRSNHDIMQIKVKIYLFFLFFLVSHVCSSNL